MDDEIAISFPSSFYCPLSGVIMTDPVVDKDGNTYERKAIEDYLDAGNTFSPITKNPMKKADLVLNRNLKNAIEEVMEERNELIQIDVTAALAEQRQFKFRMRVVSEMEIPVLSAEQQKLANDIFTKANTPEPPEEIVRIAVAQCRWIGDIRFRFRVYKEFSQWLHPRMNFISVPPLDQNQKKYAQTAFMNATEQPNLTTDLQIINEAITEFTQLYPRAEPSLVYYEQIEKDRRRRWPSAAGSRRR
jgi:hypothetical protein